MTEIIDKLSWSKPLSGWMAETELALTTELSSVRKSKWDAMISNIAKKEM